MEEHLADEGPKCCKIVHVEGVSQCITDKTNLFKEKLCLTLYAVYVGR
jgi:hypothetical protein